MTTGPSPSHSSGKTPVSLRRSAHASILWGGAFMLARDVGQFVVMIILVRMLSPADYGMAAIAQAIFGFIAILSYNTISQHVFQRRDVENIDWHGQFRLAVIVNVSLFVLICGLAFIGIKLGLKTEIAMVTCAFATVLLVEIPGTMRQRMLEVAHNWARFRLLAMAGTILGLGSGLATAYLGGGIWALVIQYPMLALPSAVDLFIGARFQPRWRTGAMEWQGVRQFTGSRVTALTLGKGRALLEQSFISGTFGISSLGLFNRANGLALMTSGRVGSTVSLLLYPVLTRFEPKSDGFRRMAGLLLMSVCWTTIPAMALLGVLADDLVAILYGQRWLQVSPLLPATAVALGFYGITQTLSSLLLAHHDVRDSALPEVVMMVATGLIILFYPSTSLLLYPIVIAVVAAVAASLSAGLLSARGGILLRDIVSAFGIPLAVSIFAAVILLWSREAIMPGLAGARVVLEAVLFAVLYLGTIRLLFRAQLAAVVDILPGAGRLRSVLQLAQPR